MTLVRRLALAASILLAPPALAQVAVVDPWVRGVVPAQKTTGAFMELRAAADTTLVGASSPAAKIVEIHQMKMDGGVMRMSAVDKIALPAGKAVKLEPGGYHVMLLDLAHPLAVGDHVPLTLTFAKAGSIDVVADVEPVQASDGHKR